MPSVMVVLVVAPSTACSSVGDPGTSRSRYCTKYAVTAAGALTGAVHDTSSSYPVTTLPPSGGGATAARSCGRRCARHDAVDSVLVKATMGV